MTEHWTGEDPFDLPEPGSTGLPGEHLDPGAVDGPPYHGHDGPGWEQFPPDPPDPPYHGDDGPGWEQFPPDPPGPPDGDEAPLAEPAGGWPVPDHPDPTPAGAGLFDPAPADAVAAGHADPVHPAAAAVAPAGQLGRADALPQHLDSSPFPAYLEVDVAPADGQHWVDPELLGEPEPHDPHTAPGTGAAGALRDLRAAEGGDPVGSEDPAIRALARFWAGSA